MFFTLLIHSRSISQYQFLIDQAILSSKSRKPKTNIKTDWEAGVHTIPEGTFTFAYNIIGDQSSAIQGFAKAKHVLALAQMDNKDFSDYVFHTEYNGKFYKICECAETSNNVKVYKTIRINESELIPHYSLSIVQKIYRDEDSSSHSVGKEFYWTEGDDGKLESGKPDYNLLELLKKKKEEDESDSTTDNSDSTIEDTSEKKDSNWLRRVVLENLNMAARVNVGGYIQGTVSLQCEKSGSNSQNKVELDIQVCGGVLFGVLGDVTFPGFDFIDKNIPIRDIPVMIGPIPLIIHLKANLKAALEDVTLHIPFEITYFRKYTLYFTQKAEFGSNGINLGDRSFKFVPYVEKPVMPSNPSISDFSLEFPFKFSMGVNVTVEIIKLISTGVLISGGIKVPVVFNLDKSKCPFPYININIEPSVFWNYVFDGFKLLGFAPKFAKKSNDSELYRFEPYEHCFIDYNKAGDGNSESYFQDPKSSFLVIPYIYNDYTSTNKVLSVSVKSNSKYIASKVYPLNYYSKSLTTLSPFISLDVSVPYRFEINALTNSAKEAMGNVDCGLNTISSLKEIMIDDGYFSNDKISVKIETKGLSKLALGKISTSKSTDKYMMFEPNRKGKYCVWKIVNDKWSLTSYSSFYDTKIPSDLSNLDQIKIWDLTSTSDKHTNLQLQFVNPNQDVVALTNNVYLSFSKGSEIYQGIFIPKQSNGVSSYTFYTDLDPSIDSQTSQFITSSDRTITFNQDSIIDGEFMHETLNAVFPINGNYKNINCAQHRLGFLPTEKLSRIVFQVDSNTKYMPTRVFEYLNRVKGFYQFWYSVDELSGNYFTIHCPINIENLDDNAFIYLASYKYVPILDYVPIETHLYLIPVSELKKYSNYILLRACESNIEPNLYIYEQPIQMISGKEFYDMKNYYPGSSSSCPYAFIGDFNSYYICVQQNGQLDNSKIFKLQYDNAPTKVLVGIKTDTQYPIQFIDVRYILKEDETSKRIDLSDSIYNGQIDISFFVMPYRKDFQEHVIVYNHQLRTIEEHTIEGNFLHLNGQNVYTVYRKCEYISGDKCANLITISNDQPVMLKYTNKNGILPVDIRKSYSINVKKEIFYKTSQIAFYKSWIGTVERINIPKGESPLEISIEKTNEFFIIKAKLGSLYLPISQYFINFRLSELLNELHLKAIDQTKEIEYEVGDPSDEDIAIKFKTTNIINFVPASGAKRVKSSSVLGEAFGLDENVFTGTDVSRVGYTEEVPDPDPDPNPNPDPDQTNPDPDPDPNPNPNPDPNPNPNPKPDTDPSPEHEKPQESPSDEDGSKGGNGGKNNTGGIVAGVVIGILVVVGVAVALFILYKRKQNNNENSKNDAEDIEDIESDKDSNEV